MWLTVEDVPLPHRMERTAIPPRVNINHLRLVHQKRDEG
jgi:hypothetical protein